MTNPGPLALSSLTLGSLFLLHPVHNHWLWLTCAQRGTSCLPSDYGLALVWKIREFFIIYWTPIPSPRSSELLTMFALPWLFFSTPRYIYPLYLLFYDSWIKFYIGFHFLNHSVISIPWLDPNWKRWNPGLVFGTGPETKQTIINLNWSNCSQSLVYPFLLCFD